MNGELLQYALVGDLLQGGIAREKTLELIAQHGFKADYVTVPELRTAYDILVAEKTNDATLLRQAVVGKLSVETLEKAASKASDNALDIEEHVKGVGDAAKYREMDAIYESVKRTPATPEWKAAELKRQFADYFRDVTSKAAVEGYSLAELQEPIPEEDDPDCLVKGEFLYKGAPLVLVAPSGEGKSVIALQFAYAWALGRPALGIAPLRPLKIGVFQTEDSDRKIARMRVSMRQAYERFLGWTADDIRKAEENIRFYSKKKMGMGDNFIEYLRRTQLNEKSKCDLAIVNPLQGVTGFDISSNADMSVFLRQKLDGVIKYDDETKCGVIIVHHTNKPPAANMRAGFGTDQFAQYVGAGAAELANWMRTMLVIMPTGEQGMYKMVAAKNGEELGWPRLMVNGKPTAKPTKIIRHSTPEENVMFWHEVDAAPAPTAKTEKPSVTKDAAQLANVLQKDGMTLTAARKFAKEMLGRKRGEAAYEEMMANLSVYNVVIKPTGKASQSIVGSVESVEKYFSQLQEKEAAEMRAKLAKIDAGK